MSPAREPLTRALNLREETLDEGRVHAETRRSRRFEGCAFLLSASSAPPRENGVHARAGLITFESAGTALRSSLSRAQTHPCVILSGGGRGGGGEGSNEAAKRKSSEPQALPPALASDNGRPNTLCRTTYPCPTFSVPSLTTTIARRGSSSSSSRTGIAGGRNAAYGSPASYP